MQNQNQTLNTYVPSKEVKGKERSIEKMLHVKTRMGVSARDQYVLGINASAARSEAENETYTKYARMLGAGRQRQVLAVVQAKAELTPDVIASVSSHTDAWAALGRALERAVDEVTERKLSALRKRHEMSHGAVTEEQQEVFSYMAADAGAASKAGKS